MFDSRSRKVGSVAAGFIVTRPDGVDMMIDLLLADYFRTKQGRMRASYVLNVLGRNVSRANEAYLHLLSDRSPDVIDNALFGLVFSLADDCLPIIEAQASKSPVGSTARRYFDSAIRALRARNPFLFSSGYVDSDNRWGLKDSPLKALAESAEAEEETGH